MHARHSKLVTSWKGVPTCIIITWVSPVIMTVGENSPKQPAINNTNNTTIIYNRVSG